MYRNITLLMHYFLLLIIKRKQRYLKLVSIMHQIIKRASEGIAAMDDGGRSTDCACDLHLQF